MDDFLVTQGLADEHRGSTDAQARQRGRFAEDFSLHLGQRGVTERHVTLTGPSSHHVGEALNSVGALGFSLDREASIESRVELRTEEIFRRHSSFVHRGIDFFRRFRGEGFEDVGDFDVFAYWPHANLLVTVECKYNQTPYTVKDGRRLRDRTFGKAEDDKAGQFSRILRRRQFLEKNRLRLLELLTWPQSEAKPFRHVEVYVSRDMYYWMVHPPYPVPTKFVRVDALDAWIKTELISSRNHV